MLPSRMHWWQKTNFVAKGRREILAGIERIFFQGVLFKVKCTSILDEFVLKKDGLLMLLAMTVLIKPRDPFKRIWNKIGTTFSLKGGR